MEENNKIFKRVRGEYRKPYIYDEKAKCLRQLQFLMSTFDVETGNSEHQWKMAETGEIITGDLAGEIYLDKIAFNNGRTISHDSLYENMTESQLLNRVPVSHRSFKDERVYIWTFENGQAVKWFFDEHINEVVETISDKGDYTIWKADAEIPESYSCAEEVFEYNDYEVVHNDGTREYHEGVLNRLTLTPGQKALADKLQSVINECIEAGMAIDFDYSDYSLMAYNQSQIKEIGYDVSYDEDTEERYRLGFRKAYTFKGVGDINTDDDYYLVISKDSLKKSK